MMMVFNNQKKLKKFRLKGIKVNTKPLYFGFYGLISLETGRIDSKVLESFVQTIKRQAKLEGGKYWFSLNDCIPITQTAIGTRMGKGKGNFFKHVAFVRKGQILCELSVFDRAPAFSILKKAASKLPVKARIVTY